MLSLTAALGLTLLSGQPAPQPDIHYCDDYAENCLVIRPTADEKARLRREADDDRKRNIDTRK